MTQNYSKLDTQTITQVCGTLENIVSHAYGPRGSKTLLSTETGQVLISSDGTTVLRRLQFAHPMSRLIIDSMTRNVNFTGDGGKTFILYLTNFVKGLLLHEQTNKSVEANSYIAALQKVKLHISSNLSIYIRATVPNGWREVTPKLCQNVIQTCLSNTFNKSVSEHLSLLASNVFRKFETRKYSITQVLQCIVDCFEELCIKIPTLPYNESKAVSPYIIQRKFATCSQSSNEYPRLITCLFPISGHPKNLETREVVNVKSMQSLTNIMNHHQFLLKNFVKSCKNEEINLILCSEDVSEQALQLFKSSEISVVPYVPEEDCEWLLKHLHLKPCIGILEQIDVDMIGTAKTCRTMVINGRQCVHLDLSNHDNELMLPEMLLICAPTEGLCNQVCLKLRKLYHTLLVGCTEGNNSNISDEKVLPNSSDQRQNISIVGGGGSFEFLTSEFLLEFGNNKDTHLDRACKMLSKALLNIPFILFKNNSPSIHMTQLDLKGYLISLEAIKQARSSGIFLGFDRFGKPSDLINDNIIELSEVKIHVLMSVIELVQQILRVDCIVGVEKLHQDNLE